MSKTITMKSTKAEIMEAYEAVKKKLDDVEMSKDDPTVALEVAKKVKKAESADNLIGLGILNEDIVASYEDLMDTIADKKSELKDLYGIEVEANSLVALINASKDKKRELEETTAARLQELEDEYAKKKIALDEEYDVLKREKQEEIKQLDESYEEAMDLAEKKRKRQEEEYAYETQRKRMKENDEWEDEKTRREKAMAERERELDIREEAVIEAEDHINSLEEQVKNMPDQIDEAYTNGCEKGKKDTERSKAIEINALKTKHEYELSNLEAQKARLEEDLAVAREENKVLQSKLDGAYAQMRELAADTVKNAGGVKILDRENTNSK